VRHVLAAQTIAARGRLHQAPRLVAETDRQPVELRFRRVLDLLDVFEPLAHAAVESDHVLVLEGVVERQHRPRVHDLLQLVDGRRADALSRRIGRDEIRILFFERLELAQQPVVFGVGNFRVVEHVVAIVVMLDLSAQLTHSRSGDLGGHK
jgi:hypothetical protein